MARCPPEGQGPLRFRGRGRGLAASLHSHPHPRRQLGCGDMGLGPPPSETGPALVHPDMPPASADRGQSLPGTSQRVTSFDPCNTLTWGNYPHLAGGRHAQQNLLARLRPSSPGEASFNAVCARDRCTGDLGAPYLLGPSTFGRGAAAPGQTAPGRLWGADRRRGESEPE